jgi:hypothetical protein
MPLSSAGPEGLGAGLQKGSVGAWSTPGRRMIGVGPASRTSGIVDRLAD